MIIEEILAISSTKKDLRNFGLLVGGVLVFLGWLTAQSSHGYYPGFSLAGFMLIGLGFIWPYILKPAHKLWMTFAIIMGWFISRLLLTILYYLIITPIGYFSRQRGKVFIDMGNHDDKLSYWHDRKSDDQSIYNKQY